MERENTKKDGKRRERMKEVKTNKVLANYEHKKTQSSEKSQSKMFVMTHEREHV